MLKKKKGQAGNAVQYLTRNQALKKLQLKLSEFRRLCILKGIHPREPRKKPHGAHKTYYHAKDVAFLLHEPLLKKVRELAAYDKKVRRATAKKNRDLAIRLAARRPTYRLDHLVKERYPSFVDALRDLDDPLTLVHLFAVLPADADYGIPAERVHLARRLALEWQAWVVRTHALRKAFISVKGYYFQAQVQGQSITWLVPHQTSQVLPKDVDFKVMLTFLELYQTTLQFVLYRLYHAEGMLYPPVVDVKLEEAAAGLQAIMADLAKGLEGDETQNDKKRMSKRRRRRNGGRQPEVNAEVGARMENLSAKVAELEAEIVAMETVHGSSISKDAKPTVTGEKEGGSNKNEKQAAEEESESEGDDEDLEIDSGAEEEEEDSDNEDALEEESDLEEDPSGSEDEQERDDDVQEADPTAGPLVVASQTDTQLVGGSAEVAEDDEDGLCASLFRGLVFFLGREVPREQLLLVIGSFGGEAGWAGEGSPFDEDDERITHHVIDRPLAIEERRPNREYVQPQWVFDGANARVLVRGGLYAPGVVPPPHLSPFVDPQAEGYEPEYAKEIKELQKAARVARARAGTAALGDGGFLALGDAVGDEDVLGAAKEDSIEAAEARYAAELASELKGVKERETIDGDVGGEVPSRKRARKADGDDDEAMKEIMMTRKVRKVYEKAKREKEAKAARVESLQAKAAALKSK